MRWPVQLTSNASKALSTQFRCITLCLAFCPLSPCIATAISDCQVLCQGRPGLSNKSAGNPSGGAFKDLSRDDGQQSHHRHTAHGWRLGDLRPEAGVVPFCEEVVGHSVRYLELRASSWPSVCGVRRNRVPSPEPGVSQTQTVPFGRFPHPILVQNARPVHLLRIQSRTLRDNSAPGASGRSGTSSGKRRKPAL